MDTNYNGKEHDQLLKYSEDLKKHGKFLSEESPTKFLKLLNYSAMVYSQLEWEIRDQYLEIFEEFLSNKITSADFCEILEEKVKLNSELSDKFLSYPIHQKALSFTDFIDNLYIACEVCDRSPISYRQPGDISESELRKEIQKTYLQIQKLLEE